MSNCRKVIGAALLAILLAAGAERSTAETGLQEKFDSLFMVASSGEVRFKDLTGPAMDSIAAMGVDVVPLLIDKFTTKDALERWTVIWIFQRIGSPAVPYLVRALKRDDDLVLARVCWALGDIKDTTAVMPLIDVCNRDSWQVRDEAIAALGRIADRRAAGTVMAALKDAIGQVRKSAVVTCGQLKLDEAARPLVHALNDDFYGARLTAVNTLCGMDSGIVLQVVGDSLDSPSAWVGNLGCRVLGAVGGDRAMELLLNQTRSSNPERRACAAEALIEADPLDNCNFRRYFVPQETNPLVLLRIQSALDRRTNEKEQP